jgi:hypothetical protein
LQDFEISCLKNYNTDFDEATAPKLGIRSCINGVYELSSLRSKLE